MSVRLRKDFRKSYIGGFAGSLKQLPGEDWNRGNDFPDGHFSKTIVKENLQRMLTWLIKPISKTAQNCQKREDLEYNKMLQFKEKYNGLSTLKDGEKCNISVFMMLSSLSGHPVLLNTIYNKEEHRETLTKFFEIRYSEYWSNKHQTPIIRARCRTNIQEYIYYIIYNCAKIKWISLKPAPEAVVLQTKEEHFMKDLDDSYTKWHYSDRVEYNSETGIFPNMSPREEVIPVEDWVDSPELPYKDCEDVCAFPEEPVKKDIFKSPINLPVGEDIPEDALVTINDKGQIVLASSSTYKENLSNYLGFNSGKKRLKGEHILAADIKLKNKNNLYIFRNIKLFSGTQYCLGSNGGMNYTKVGKDKVVYNLGTAITENALMINPKTITIEK